MSHRPHMPIREFRDLGYLQEANRQFFHPHGLALEIARIADHSGDSDWAQPPIYALALGAPEYKRLLQALADSDDGTETFARLRRLVEDQPTRYELGDAYLSGVWDYRDDPEGMLFGDLPKHSDAGEKAAHVRANRDAHFTRRLELFHPALDSTYPHILEGPDVEPVNWVDSTDR